MWCDVKQNYKVFLTTITVFTLFLASGFILFGPTDAAENMCDQADRICEGYTPEELRPICSNLIFNPCPLDTAK